jgi:hypothetical protein
MIAGIKLHPVEKLPLNVGKALVAQLNPELSLGDLSISIEYVKFSHRSVARAKLEQGIKDLTDYVTFSKYDAHQVKDDYSGTATGHEYL